MRNFEARVHVDGRVIKVTIRAQNGNDAKALLEAQYGRGSLRGLPVEVR